VNIFGVCITALLISVILLFPRRWAALAIFAAVIYITQGQSFLIGGFNITAMRLIELAGLLRVIVRREKIIGYNNIDKAFFAYSIVYLLIYLIRCIFDISSRELMIYQIGVFTDGIIVYFMFRGLICSLDGFVRFIKDIVILLIPFTVFMIMESITGRNIFSYIYGVSIVPDFRGGYFRSQGSFRHAILAGSIGATMFPLFYSLTVIGGNNIIGIFGMMLCIIIVVASHSSGPLMALSFGIMAWIIWPLRNSMKKFRWGIAFLLLSLHLMMKAPVWFLFARISDIIGGDGWHRANLIGKWINSIGQWWIMGMSLDKTKDWAATMMRWGAIDITNTYVSIGINGGIISLIFFIILLINCYINIGRKMEQAKNNDMKNNELIYWGLGASLTSHIVNLTGVTYYDQFYVIWYMLIAIISGITHNPTPVIEQLKEGIFLNNKAAISLKKNGFDQENPPGLQI
jgi:hypothetical protein